MNAVDVLADLRGAANVERDWGDRALASKIDAAADAVAELIEACIERNEAEGLYGAAESLYGEDSNADEMRAARGRMIKATKRYGRALARVQGEAA